MSAFAFEAKSWVHSSAEENGECRESGFSGKRCRKLESLKKKRAPLVTLESLKKKDPHKRGVFLTRKTFMLGNGTEDQRRSFFIEVNSGSFGAREEKLRGKSRVAPLAVGQMATGYPKKPYSVKGKIHHCTCGEPQKNGIFLPPGFSQGGANLQHCIILRGESSQTESPPRLSTLNGSFFKDTETCKAS